MKNWSAYNIKWHDSKQISFTRGHKFFLKFLVCISDEKRNLDKLLFFINLLAKKKKKKSAETLLIKNILKLSS